MILLVRKKFPLYAKSSYTLVSRHIYEINAKHFMIHFFIIVLLSFFYFFFTSSMFLRLSSHYKQNTHTLIILFYKCFRLLGVVPGKQHPLLKLKAYDKNKYLYVLLNYNPIILSLHYY